MSANPNLETLSDNPNLARQGWQRSLSTSTSTSARGQRSGRRFEWPSLPTSAPSRALPTSAPSRALSPSALASADGLDAGTASAVAAGLVALTRGGDVEGQARAAHALATLALDGEGRSAIALIAC
jgi:hypothetical protein